MSPLKADRIAIASRVLAVALVAIAYFMPIWTIKLSAPFYGSEWVTISVYPNRIEGPLDQLNIINHYVGLAPIEPDKIAALQYAPLLFYALLALTVVSVSWNNRAYKMIVLAAFLFVLLLLPIMVYYWLYSYGHDISPEAPIKISPFTPPVLGENRLANFTTISYLDSGYWLLVIAAIVMMVLPKAIERIRNRG